MHGHRNLKLSIVVIINADFLSTNSAVILQTRAFYNNLPKVDECCEMSSVIPYLGIGHLVVFKAQY